MSRDGVDSKKPKRQLFGVSVIFWIIFVLFIVIVLIAEPNSMPYRVAGAVNGAIFGAIGGGLGALLEFAVKRRWGTSALTLGVIVGFLVGHGVDQSAQLFGDNFFQTAAKPRVDRAVLERRLVNDPESSLFKTLRDYDPDRFSRVLDELVKLSRTTESTEQIINQVRKTLIEPILSEKAAFLPDESLIRYIKLVMNELRVYALRKPELCVFTMHGQALGDVRPYLTKQLVSEEHAILEETIKLKMTTQTPLYTESELNTLVEPMILKLVQKHGDAVQLLDASAETTGREQQVCEVGADYFQEIAALPKASAAKLMRTFLASAHQ